jgi:tetratricopeptide (TPR) repeat protein
LTFRTWLVGAAVLGCLAASLPLARRYSAGQVETALSVVDLRAAETWLARLQQLGADRADRLRLELRCLRKKGAIREFQNRLETARQSGVDEAFLHRELLLANAQAGDLRGLERELPDLLVAGDDLEEICEAFVTGCLLAYRLEDVTRVLEIWQQDFPESARPVFLRARLREHADDLPTAAAGYREALELNPRHGPAAFSLGRVLEQSDDLSGALNAYSRSRELLYHAEPALVSMARVLRLQDRLDEAQTMLDSPEITQGTAAERELAWLLAGATRQNAVTDRLIEVAELHAARGDNELALEAFRNVLATDPQLWKLRYRYGMLLRELGHDEAGREQLTRFQAASEAIGRCDVLLSRVRRDPNDIEARFGIGCEFLDHISASQGLVWLRTVLELDPQHAGALQKLAEFSAAPTKSSPIDNAPN